MTGYVPPAAPPAAGRNTLGIVAIALVGLLVIVSLATQFVPRIAYEFGQSPVAISTALSVVSLVLLLAAAATALLGLRHPRRALPAIALGYCVAGLISFALWAGVLPLIQPLLQR